MRNQYLTRCNQCGNNTSRTYARNHAGKCKPCHEGVPRKFDDYNERRNALIIDSGWQAYQREDGAYDIPDNY